MVTANTELTMRAQEWNATLSEENQ